MKDLKKTERIDILKDKMLAEPRYASIEQARIITRVYKENEDKSTVLKRALSLKPRWRNSKLRCSPRSSSSATGPKASARVWCSRNRV